MEVSRAEYASDAMANCNESVTNHPRLGNLKHDSDYNRNAGDGSRCCLTFDQHILPSSIKVRGVTQAAKADEESSAQHMRKSPRWAYFGVDGTIGGRVCTVCYSFQTKD